MKKIVPDNEEQTRKSMISVRGGFSDRNGMDVVTNSIQVFEFDHRTRTILSNKIRKFLEFMFKDMSSKGLVDRPGMLTNDFCVNILSEVFLQKIDLHPSREYNWISVYDNMIYKVFSDAPYNEVLDMIWYISNWIHTRLKNYENVFFSYTNELFEQECVGYRFVGGYIEQITDKVEIEAIEKVVCSSLEGCKTHIKNALSILSDREKKDYKNCIKESISAVESICKVITNDEHATLGDALKKLERKRNLKGQLKSAFEKLYNYTNDKGGIRHADGLFVSEVTFEEAKFMLVSCSAFVNYLIAEYGKISEK